MTEPSSDRRSGPLREPNLGGDNADFRLLVESVRDYAIFMLDPEGRIASWNAGAEMIKGYPAEEVLGRSFSIFYPPEAIELNAPQVALASAARHGRYTEEGWRVRRDGSRFWASVVITALRDRRGGLIGYAKVTRDLTDRRRAEQALRESEARLQTLVENVQDHAVIALDLEGRILSWNAGAERLTGYTAEEAVGQTETIFHPGEDDPAGRSKNGLERAHREGRFAEEAIRVRKGGERFWANVSITALRNADGEVVGFFEVFRDLTERIRVLTELEESEARLAGIISSAMDGIITTDEQRSIIVFNQAAERLFGVLAADAIGSSLDRFIPPRFREAHKQHLRNFGATGETSRSMHKVPGALPALRADGTEFPIEATISQTTVGSRRLFTVVIRDVSERLRAEQERERVLNESELARIAAEEASHSKTQFLATMSHELRTPLNAIIGYEQLLEDGIAGPVNDVQRRQLGRIRHSALHLLDVINEILTIARVDAGRETLKLAEVTVEEIVSGTATMLEPHATEKGLRLVTGSADRGISLRTDPHKLRQILINLLSNAIKFTEGGEVELSARCLDQEVEFRVRDTGIGIGEEDLPFIFERFWQAQRTMTRSYEGTGLGLAVCQRLATLLGGRITVQSAPGAGSVFRLHLPHQLDGP